MSKSYIELLEKLNTLGIKVTEKDLHIYFSPTMDEEIEDKRMMYERHNLL